MSLRYSLICVIISVYWSLGFSQHIEGRLYDKNTGKPVSLATVYDKTSSAGAISDSSGHFTIVLKKQNSHSLYVSHIGYKKYVLNYSSILSDTAIVLYLEPLEHDIAEVKITASPLRQALTQSYPATIIDADVIENKIATALIDVLNEVPGITKQAEYHSPIVLRGLKGKRLLITKDGNRRMGNFPDGFMGQGLNIYDLAKIEVIKGPASVKYGPGAISGIINMESKEPFNTPGIHGKTITSYGTNNTEKTVISNVNWCNMDHAISASGRFRDAGDYKYGGNAGPAANSNYRDKDMRLAYTYENNYALRLSAESEVHLGGPWGRPVGFNGTKYVKMYNIVDNTWHSAISAIWKPDRKLKKVEISVYGDTEKRNQIRDSYDVGSGKLSYREDISYKNYYMGWRASTETELTPKVGINSGFDGVFYRIESPTQLTDYFLNTEINNKVTKDAGVALAGMFSELEFHSTDNRLTFRAGLRCDFAHIHEGDVHDTTFSKGRNSKLLSWSGTSGIVYTIQDNIYASFQVARSCRMPDATEMFISSSNSDGMVYGNPTLKPEYGLNLDAGIRGKAGSIYFDCSLFANFLHNFISLEYWTNSGKKGINYMYYNIDRARIMGIEIACGAKWQHVIHPDNTITYNTTLVYTRGDKLTDEPNWFRNGVPLRNIPPFNTKHEVLFRRFITSSKSCYIGADYTYYAQQLRTAPSSDGGYSSPYYNVAGAMAGFSVRQRGITYDIKIRIDNITNNFYYPFESLIPGMGRNFKILLSILF